MSVVGSGRYPFGTETKTNLERDVDFVSRINKYRKAGYSNKEISEALGINSVEKFKAMEKNSKKNIKETKSKED